MITKKIFQIAIFFAFLFTSLNSYADYYIEWTGATENFANGAANQVAYIDFGDVSLWGCLEITLSGGWNYQNTTGMYTKRYQIGRNSNGGIYCQSAEVPASIGYVSSQWKLGDFQIDQNNHIKIPIYHLVTTQNQIVVHISAISAAEINKSLITLTSPTTVTNNEQKDYYSIKDQVGIGTTTPRQTLEVAGSSLFDGDMFTWQNGGIFFSGNGSYSAGIYGRNAGNDLVFNSGGAEKMRINSSGNLGIGTQTPDQKLTVKGKIHAEEVIVDLNVPVADYVFKPNYKLMSLPEVEQFVKTNSHLPEIPSATEITKNGLSMGEMQNKLLQKVEELTLYAIQQNKKIETIQKENEQYKAERINLLTEQQQQLLELKKEIDTLKKK